MGDKTGIQWADATWNPIRGCGKVSAGCANCYAEKTAHRFSGPGQPYDGLTADGRWNGKVAVVEKHLDDPMRWRKPRRVFVNSMSDLFHESLSEEDINRVFMVMALCNGEWSRCYRAGCDKSFCEGHERPGPNHQFQVLTKRPGRMREYLGAPDRAEQLVGDIPSGWYFGGNERHILKRAGWPLPNVWLGVSCEDQAAADERIPLLLDTPAAVRFVSAEPLLGPVDLNEVDSNDVIGSANDDFWDATDLRPAHLDWVITGGESGPGARPCNVEWIESIVDQCQTAGVPCFVKQLGTNPIRDGEPLALAYAKGANPAEWPEHLRVQEYPDINREERGDG